MHVTAPLADTAASAGWTDLLNNLHSSGVCALKMSNNEVDGFAIFGPDKPPSSRRRSRAQNDELLDFQWFGQSKLGHHQHWEQLLSSLPLRRSTNAFLATIDEKDKKIEMISIASKVLTTAAEPAASRHIKGQISRNNNAHVRGFGPSFFSLLSHPLQQSNFYSRVATPWRPQPKKPKSLAPLAHLFVISISVARTNLDQRPISAIAF